MLQVCFESCTRSFVGHCTCSIKLQGELFQVKDDIRMHSGPLKQPRYDWAQGRSSREGLPDVLS